jgi:predicted RNA methylase
MQVNTEVMNILSNSSVIGNMLQLPGHLTRPLYLQANTVIEAAGGKWSKKHKAHVFTSDASEAIEQIVLTGMVTIPQDFGYFPSPQLVVDQVLNKAEINKRHQVLEPNAGRGAIALRVADIGATVDCVELLDENYKQLCLLAQQGELNGLVFHCDFLSMAPAPVYDRIVMNPPFAKQADIHHVLHALRFLKPIGLLVSVMAAGVTFRDNKLTVEFRRLVSERGGDIEALPENSFKESGTSVNTVIVTIPGA